MKGIWKILKKNFLIAIFCNLSFKRYSALFFDAFFKSMSVVLVFGLSFGTLLTLVVLPVFYAASFGVRTTETQALAEGEITT